jgi:hypothetical protein
MEGGAQRVGLVDHQGVLGFRRIMLKHFKIDFENDRDQGVLIGESAIHRSNRHARAFGEFIHRHGIKRLFTQQAGECDNQLVPCLT